VYLSIFISVINQPDAQNFCFTISLFHASTCFEQMYSKHVEAWNKLIVKQKFCASSWLITGINFNRMFLELRVIHKRIQNSKWLRQPSRTVQASFKKRYTEKLLVLNFESEFAISSAHLRCRTSKPCEDTLKTLLSLTNVTWSAFLGDILAYGKDYLWAEKLKFVLTIRLRDVMILKPSAY